MEDAPNSEKGTSKSDRASSAQDVTNDQAKECPKYTSDRISRHDLTLNRRVRIVKGAEEVWVGEQSAENTLIIPYTESQL